MINIYEAQVLAWVSIADLVGRTYFRSHFEGSCSSYVSEDNGKKDLMDFEYFIGFEAVDDLWTVFARVSVNRETEEVTFLDYKLPDGKRMENPPKPVRFA